uniref:Tyrosinase_Cu-bd domain-containing protein n=1 Tax=Panagrellus redivivus TaxID=6233 RepID=A0A7E4W5S9_PANRE
MNLIRCRTDCSSADAAVLITHIMVSILSLSSGCYGSLPSISTSENTEMKQPSSDCASLPAASFLTIQQTDLICHHREMWMRDREAKISRTFIKNPTVSQLAYLKSLERCSPDDAKCTTDDQKRQRHKRNLPKKDGEPVIRKEYRMLSDEERGKLNQAMNALKSKFIDNVTIWDLHTLIHYPDSAPGAHWGPAFLPWHREFLRQFELALQREVPGVALPYWDSTLDNGLPDPSDSILWTDNLMGNGNGFVKTGPFRDWDTNVLMPLSPVPVKKLYRYTGGRSTDRLLSQSDVDWVTSRKNYSDLTFCHDKTFESMHGLSHVWVGGFMFVIRVSPNDPTFYMHHAFVDFMWEQFRQKQQTRQQREKEYARKICSRQHSYYAPMKPFNLRNKDGLSNDYTDNWYKYEPVRHCSFDKPYCDSNYYFCDLKVMRCRSRVQLGGNCTGFAMTDICYKSFCIQGVCRLPATEGNGFQRREKKPTGVVWAKTLMLTDGDEPLVSGIAHVTVRDDAGSEMTAYMQKNPEFPEVPGLLYLPLTHPREGLSYNVTLEARDHYGRYCQSYCFNETVEKYQVCEPKLTLKVRPDAQASNLSFTHSYASRKFLDMDMSGHPTQWKIHSPFMIFACHRKMIDSAQIASITENAQMPVDRTEYVWFRVNVFKKPASDVDIDEAEIEVQDLDDPSDLWISSIRRARSAYDQSNVFIRARNPLVFRKGVTVKINIRDGTKRLECESRCSMGSTFEDKCENVVFLHERPTKSQEQIFASDPSYLQLLGWKMVGHPNNWSLRMPYLSFYC